MSGASSLSERHIGFVGGGAMAEALCGGLLAAGVPMQHVRVAEPVAERRAQLATRLGVVAEAGNHALLPTSDVIVLAVKPGVVPTALAALAESATAVERARPLWISIAAGVPLAVLERGLPLEARIVRAMPNTPALIRAGATALCGNARSNAADRATAQALFESVGTVWQTSDETLLDAVTGLSGSGPAYVFLLLEALVDAGAAVGLPRDAASQLVLHTVRGAAQLAVASDRTPEELRAQVSSPGGTTLAGLKELEDGGLRALVERAVRAATRRSQELGRAAAASEDSSSR